MFPHEKSLVQRHRDAPFALIGVNSDADREMARNKNTELGINWRSFWNGPKATQGPISTRWGIRSWPVLFLIDHEGVLRFRWVGNPGAETLDRCIGELLKIARRDATARSLTETEAKAERERLEKELDAGFNPYVDSLNKAKDESEESIAHQKRDAEVRNYGLSLLSLARRAPPEGAFSARCRLRVLSLANSDHQFDDLSRQALTELLKMPLDSRSLRRCARILTSAAYSLGREDCLNTLEKLAKKTSVPSDLIELNLAAVALLAPNARSIDDQTRARQLFEKIAAAGPNKEQAQRARQIEVEIFKLQIGQQALELQGRDLTGADLKLSDFRGQVVLVEFWGNW